MNTAELAKKLFIRVNKSILIDEEWLLEALSNDLSKDKIDSNSSIDLIKQLYPYI
jgi:hypothetical protein